MVETGADGAEQSAHAKLLDWAIKRGAFVHPALELKVGESVGRGWSLSEDVLCGTTLISVPLSLCIPAPGSTRRTAGAAWHSCLRAESARRVAEHLAGVCPPLHQACTHAVLLAYLLAHQNRRVPSRASGSQAGTAPNLFGLPLPQWLFDAEDQEQDASTGGEIDLPGCGFAPYLACLPRLDELDMLPTWPSEMLDELSCTSLAPQVKALRGPGFGGEEMAAFLTSAMPAVGAQENADGGAMTHAVAQSYLEHATLLCKSRAFVMSADGHNADSSRLLVPLVDMINHSTEPSHICTRVRVAERQLPAECALDQLELKGSSQAPMDEDSDVTATVVELVTTRNTTAGTSLCLQYGDLSSADCLQRFGFVEDVAVVPQQAGVQGGIDRADVVQLPSAEAASVPLDAVVAACRVAQPGDTSLQLDTLAEQRLERQAAAGDRTMHNDCRSSRCDDIVAEVIRIGHPDDDHGLEPLLAAIRLHSGESLEQAIIDRCYNSDAIRTVARDVIGWTIACHWPCTLEEELRRLHDAEIEMELDESLALAGVDESSPAYTEQPALVLRQQLPGTANDDRLASQQTDYVDDSKRGAGRPHVASWFTVQVARLRVRELTVLSRWHESLACG